MILHILLPLFNGFVFPLVIVHYLQLFVGDSFSWLTVLCLLLLAAAFALHLFKYRYRAKHGRPRWAIWLEVLVPMAMFYPVVLLIAQFY